MGYTKRPAVLLTIAYISALGVGHLLCDHSLSLWLLAAFGGVFLFLYMVLFDGRKHLFLSALIVAAVIYAGVQCHNENQEYLKWNALRGDTVKVEGTVENVTYASDSISYVLARISSVEGERTSVALSLSLTGGVRLSQGEAFSGVVHVLPLEESSRYLLQNSSYYRAEGIVGEAELEEEGFVSHGIPLSIRGAFEALRTRLSALLSYHIPYDELSFLSGMVFGDREAIEPSVARDFRRTGTSHLLAVSGSHLSVMIAALYYLCTKLRVRRVPTVIILSLTVAFVVCLTGFPLSVVRAALMWGVGAFAFFFGGRRDGYSALAISVLIICACDMRAIYDIGLQMSVLSTLGILVLGIPTDKWLALHMPKDRASRFARNYLFMPTVLTVTSTIFTLPTVFFSMGEISLVAPLANLLLAIPCAVLLIATPILLLLLCLPIQAPAAFLAYTITVLTRLCLFITRILSQLPDMLFGIKYPFTPIIILLSCAFAWLFYRKKRSALVIYAAFLVGGCLFMVCHGVRSAIYHEQVTLVYQMQGRNESIGIVEGRDAVLVDISNGAKGAAYDAYRILSEKQITELDALILTHYDRKHDAMIASLCEQTVIRNLYLPKPKSDKDMEIYLAICGADYAHDAVCHVYDPSLEELHFGNARIIPMEKEHLSRSAVPITVFSVDAFDERVTYASAAAWERRIDDFQAAFDEILAHTEYLICGGHGPTVKTKFGARNEVLPYRFVSIPLHEARALLSHTAEQMVIAEDTKYIEIHLTPSD